MELPVIEEAAGEAPAGTCAEDDIDLAAFELWRQASRPQPDEKSE